MFTTREIWEAGRKALGLPVTIDTPSSPTAPAAAAPAPAPDPPAQVNTLLEVFDPSQFVFEDRTYRVTFKNRCSIECDGLALKHNFCFDPREIQCVEPIEHVGKMPAFVEDVGRFDAPAPPAEEKKDPGFYFAT